MGRKAPVIASIQRTWLDVGHVAAHMPPIPRVVSVLRNGRSTAEVFLPSLEISPGYSRFAGPGETNDETVVDRPFLTFDQLDDRVGTAAILFKQLERFDVSVQRKDRSDRGLHLARCDELEDFGDMFTMSLGVGP